MANQDHRIVSPRPDGQWDNKLAGAERASSVHDTQGEAIASAREMLAKNGGGQLTVQAPDGQIRDQTAVRAA